MTDLVTIAEYKAYKEIKSTNLDTKLASVITYISAYVETYCGRSFLDYSTVGNEKTQYGDSNNSYITLDVFPLISVASVNYSIDGGVTQIALIENTDYFVDLVNDKVITPLSTSFYSSSITFKSLEVVYLGGYLTTPEDLKLAVLDLIEIHMDGNFNNKKQQNNTIADFSNDDYKNVIPKHVRRVLNMYRII